MEIQKADPHARRKAITVIITAVFVTLTFGVVAERQQDSLIDWMEDDPIPRARLALGTAGAMTCLPLGGLAWFFARLGYRVGRARRYPPPGTAVTRDTPVRTGDAALTIARLCYAGAAFCLFTVLFAVVLFWRLIQVLTGPTA